MVWHSRSKRRVTRQATVYTESPVEGASNSADSQFNEPRIDSESAHENETKSQNITQVFSKIQEHLQTPSRAPGTSLKPISNPYTILRTLHPPAFRRTNPPIPPHSFPRLSHPHPRPQRSPPPPRQLPAPNPPNPPPQQPPPHHRHCRRPHNLHSHRQHSLLPLFRRLYRAPAGQEYSRHTDKCKEFEFPALGAAGYGEVGGGGGGGDERGSGCGC